MKKVSLLLFLILGVQSVFSQSQNYSDWNIAANQLSNGRLILAANQTTTVNYSVTVIRNLDPNGGGYLPVNLQFSLQRLPSGLEACGCTRISNIQTITSADFEADNNTLTKNYTVSVTAQSGLSGFGSIIRNDDKVVLVFTTPDGGTWPALKEVPVTVTTSTIPSVPRNVSKMDGASCRISLTWTAPTSGTPTGYKIYVNNQFYQSTSSTSTTVYNLSQNTRYDFRIRAYNSAGDGPMTAATSYTTLSDPVGTTMANPIDVTLQPQMYYYDTRSNVIENCYRNDLVADAGNEFTGQPSDDIYYKFSTQYYGELQISLCGSPFTNTRIHLLDQFGSWIHRDDNKLPLCASAQTSRVEEIKPGTYYVVIEGENSDAGEYDLSMILDTRFVTGSEFNIPVEIGELGPCTSFSDNWQWINPTFKDNYGASGDDIYYAFTLTADANIVIAACSDIHGFIVHLLNSNNEHLMTGDPDPCFISTHLVAGDYRVVVEGEPDSYPFPYNLPVSIRTESCSSSKVFSSTTPSALTNQSDENRSVLVYPVPADDVINVNSNSDAVYQVSINDAFGNEMKVWRELRGLTSLNIQDFPNGIYILHISSQDSSIVRRIEIIR